MPDGKERERFGCLQRSEGVICNAEAEWNAMEHLCGAAMVRCSELSAMMAGLLAERTDR